MAAPPLSSFLRSAKQTLQSRLASPKSDDGPLTLVIGNQSCDLDSFTSAVLYAYFRTLSPDHQLNDPCVPLLNIPRADLDLRPEFHALWSHASTDGSSLCTLSDLGDISTLSKRLPAESTTWFLTDHNKLEGPLGEIYGSRVKGVIDHHEDEHAVPEDASPRVVRPCGCCTTLVIEQSRDIWKQASWKDKAEEGRLAKMALASILVDTRALKSVDKTTDSDREVAAWLRERIEQSHGNGGFKTEEFFGEIKTAKNDISGMTAQGVFKKDYKEWTEGDLTIGMSSAVKRLNKLAKKVSKEQDGARDAWGYAADEFIKDKGCDLWMVLTSFNDDEGVHRRELALHWARAELRWVPEEFEKVYGEELQLERSKVEKMESKWHDKGGRQTWLQKNGAWSRKQVAPAIRKIMREGAPEVKSKA